MKVAVCTAFRNAERRLTRYVDQLHRLTRVAPFEVLPVWVEGDSKDRTWHLLLDHAPDFRAILTVHDHGGPEYGSFEDPIRFKQLAEVANAMWDRIPLEADAVVMLDSDLIWDPQTLVTLLDDLKWVSAAAPMVMHEGNPGLYEGPGPWFYDTFAFRKDGIRFKNEPPYHPGLDADLVQLDSAGACLAIRADLARRVRFTEEEVVVGLCKGISREGGSIWLNRGCRVYHPS